MGDADDIDLVARTMYGEARGEGFEGLHAIANVIQNRLDSGITWWGNSWQTICLKPWQFSCWNNSDPNLAFIKSIDKQNPVFRDCLAIATDAIQGVLEDITNGGTSYYSAYMDSPPHWAVGKSPCATIGHHIFFKGV